MGVQSLDFLERLNATRRARPMDHLRRIRIDQNDVGQARDRLALVQLYEHVELAGARRQDLDHHGRRIGGGGVVIEYTTVDADIGTPDIAGRNARGGVGRAGPAPP